MEDESILAVRGIYEDYLADVGKLIASRKPTDGLMGFGKRAGDDICHERFADRLEAKLNDVAKASPNSGEAYAVMSVVFKFPSEHRDDSLTYWMLIAVQGLTDALIPFLSEQDAQRLSAEFSDLYPKHSYLPVQKQLAAHLRSQAGLREQKKGFLDILKSKGGGKA